MRLQRQKCKFSRLHCLAIPRKDSSTKKTKPSQIQKNDQKASESCQSFNISNVGYSQARRTIPMVQAMRAWAGCIAGYERFPFAKLNPHNKWNDQDKMERHCSIETTVSIASKRSVCVSTEILIAAQQGRTENENFWNWNGKFQSDRTNRPRGPPLEVDHFDRKFSTQTKASHLFLDRNFRKFCYNRKHPILFLMPERRNLSGGAFLRTVGYQKECTCCFF